MNDVRYALRQLRKNVLFTVVAVGCLGAAVGLTTTALRVLDVLLVRGPAGITAPEALRRVYFAPQEGDVASDLRARTSYPVYEELATGTPTFASLAAYWTTDVGLGQGDATQLVRAAVVSPTYFATLGVDARLGRVFRPEVSGDEASVVIGHALWQSHFGGASDVTGQSVIVAGEPLTVIGVLPPDFTGLDARDVDVWLPPEQIRRVGFSGDLLYNRSAAWVQVFGRLASGVPETVAAADGARALRDQGYGAALGRAPIELGPINEATGPHRAHGATLSIWLSLLTTVVLVIACTNVASMLMARALARRREIAIRIAVGATRSRVGRQMVTESVLLMALSGAAGLLLSVLSSDLLRAVPSLPVLPPLSWQTGAVIAGVCLTTGLVFGFAPALQALATNYDHVLRAGSVGTNRATTSLRSALLVAQIALSVILLVGAALFVATFLDASRIAIGFTADRLIAVTPSMAGKDRRATDRDAELRQLHEALLTHPGVVAVSRMSSVPFGVTITVPALKPAIGSAPPVEASATLEVVDERYFETLGIPMREGRPLNATDRDAAPRVAVVNAAFVRAFSPGRSPLNECVSYAAEDDPCVRVVGVAHDARTADIQRDPLPTIYVPIHQRPLGATQFLMVRVDAASSLTPAALRRHLQQHAPNTGYIGLERMADIVAAQSTRWRLGATVFLAYSGLSLVLILAGMYGLLAFLVTQRQRDLSLRLAFGASRRDVFGVVMRWAVTRLVYGVVTGSVLAAIAATFLVQQVEGVRSLSPPMVLTAAAVLLGFGAAVSLIPAVRAATANPANVLKST